MTEAAWSQEVNPVQMLLGQPYTIAHPRKFALLAVAAYRLMWDNLDDESKRMAMAVEQKEEDCWIAMNSGGDFGDFLHNLQREEIGINCLRELQKQTLYTFSTGDVKPFLYRRASDLVRDVFGNPFRSETVHPAWLTSAVIALAKEIYKNKSFDKMSSLADALQDAGCDNQTILNHCKSYSSHVRGCWVIDIILAKP